MPRIRAAVRSGLPPLAVILEEPGRDWTRWDFRLVKAYQIRKDMMNGSGVPIYWDRSDRVQFDVGVSFSKSRAALDRAEEREREAKNAPKSYGKAFYPIPITTDGGPLPTLEEWLEEQEKKRAEQEQVKRPVPKFSNANWVGDEG